MSRCGRGGSARCPAAWWRIGRGDNVGVIWYLVKPTLGEGNKRMLPLSRMDVHQLLKDAPKDL